jgi:gliding motility-associated-like protein
VYSNTYSTASGCDSVVNITLTVNPIYTTNQTASICQGQSYSLPWGVTATTAGVYSHTYSTASGCDSVVNITLSVNSTFITNNTAAICQGQSYSLPWGGTVTTAGVYSNTYSTASGCDSVVNITLTINPIYTTNQTASICQGTSYSLPWGGTATTAGVYSHTYSTASGCDSVVNIILTLNNITPVSTTITACETYTWNGNSYNTSGDYTYAYTNTAGCLSVDTLHLTITYGTHNTASQTACETYTWNGTSYNASGDYTYAYTNSSGCPSVDTLHLIINYGTHNATSQTSCISYTWNGITYTSSGNYLYNYVNSSGCFSTDTLHLTITNGTHQSIIQSACNNFFWNGNSYSNTGIYIYNYTDVNGCASADTLHLTIFTPTSSTTQVVICNSQLPYIWNGQSLTTSGSYTTLLVNQNGCDSLAIIQLTINPTPPAPQVTPNQTICQYATTLPLSASGTYPLLWYSNPTGGTGSTAAPTPSSSIYGISHYYVSQINGNCESPRSEIIIRVVNKPDLGVDKDLHICFGETINLNTYFSTGNMTASWTSNNTIVSNPTIVSMPGEYQLVVINLFGCHDTALIQLTVQPQLNANAGPDDNAVFNEPYQLHGSGGINYVWSPANPLNFATIANPLAVLTDDTEFILTVTDDFGCTDTDTVFIKVFKGPTFYIPNAFTPNGDGVNDNFKPTYVGIQKLEYFRIYDRYGVLVFETSSIGKAWDGTYKNMKQNTGNFVYIVKGIDKNGKEKILKGNVVLIR